MFLLGLLFCVFETLAIPVGKPNAGFIEFPLRKAPKPSGEFVKDLEVKSKIASASLLNAQFYYQIRLDIGTPAQAVDFTIDTGSSDLWVMAESNPFCTQDAKNTTGINCTGSVFSFEKSRTFVDSGQPFEIAYGDHTFANGTLVSDTVRVGNGAALLNTTFGLARIGNSSTCVFGVGFIGDEGEAHVHRNKSGVYPTYFNVPTLMKAQGLIDTNAYSLWLNAAQAEKGSILFGGVDRSKFDGPLTVMPIYNNYDEFTDHPIQTRVMLNSIKADDTPLADFNIAVLLDSGTSFSYLPQELLDAFGKSLGFIYDEDIGYYFGSSVTALKNVKEFRLNFSGAEIRVPVSDLLVELTKDDGTPFILDGHHLSILTMGAVDDSYSYILGDVFLRSMYAVFDLDHYEIALAQSLQNATSSPDVALIEASIPGAIQAAGYASTSTNNSAFNIHPFTPLVPAPSVVTVDISFSVVSQPTPSATITKPPCSAAAITTVTSTVISTVTTTTTDKQDYTDSWSSKRVVTNAYSDFATEGPPVTLYWDEL